MNYYEILEVSPNASQEVIKAAYKSLMQRYHPDKNLGNADIAKHALLVGEAFDVLSDINKRSAYNIKLKQQASENREKSFEVIAPTKSKGPPLKKTDDKFNWTPLLIIVAVTVLLSLAVKQNEHTPDTTNVAHRAEQMAAEQIAAWEKAEAERKRIEYEKELATRTIPEFAVNINVRLLKKYDYAHYIYDGHTISIPVLNIRVGKHQADKVIQYAQINKELILEKLSEYLAYQANYEELIKIDGDAYLKEKIINSINDTVGTNKPERNSSGFSSQAEDYGIKEVLLPMSFSVH